MPIYLSPFQALKNPQRRYLISTSDLYLMLASVTVASLLSLNSSISFAQETLSFESQCLEDINSPKAQSVSIDEENNAHMVRINLSTRGLKYSVISREGLPQHEVLEPVLDNESSPTTQTDILARRGQVYVCAYRSSGENEKTLMVYLKSQEGVWYQEAVAENFTGGLGCQLMWTSEGLAVVTMRDDTLFMYTRGPRTWSGGAISAPNEQFGYDLQAEAHPDGTLYIAHRDASYTELYLSARSSRGNWSHEAINFVENYDAEFFPTAGVRPSIIPWSQGGVWVAHGSRNGANDLDFESDGCLLTSDKDFGEFFTYGWTFPCENGLGGDSGSLVLPNQNGVDEAFILTRKLYRNPVTTNSYDLRVFRVSRDFSIDETYILKQSQVDRPNFHKDLQALSDPFGLPVFSHQDEGGAEFGIKNCLWWLTDSDSDGLPDVGEARRGTNANLADTDADGRNDGLEVIQGSDPLVMDDGSDPTWAAEIMLGDHIGGAEAGAEAGTPAGAEGGTPAGAEGGTPAGAEGGTPAGAEGGTPAGAEGGTPAGAEGGTPAGAEGGIPAGAEAGTSAGAEGGTPAGAEAGALAGAEAGSAGHSAGHDTNTGGSTDPIDELPAGVQGGDARSVDGGARGGVEPTDDGSDASGGCAQSLHRSTSSLLELFFSICFVIAGLISRRRPLLYPSVNEP